jgi:hypothetical protein
VRALGDDNSGQASHKIKDYASSRFTYYTTEVKTCNTGAGTAEDPKCVTVWAPGGEDLNTKYGAGNANEIVDGRPMVKTGTVGGCARCGGVQGVTFEYFYLNVVEEDAADNEVVRIVIEDTIDADGNGVRRTIWGINNEGRNLREVTIIDPAGTPQFWCRSWILSQIEDARRFRMMEYRTPAAHNVTTSTIDEFLKPCHDGNFANDTARSP